MDVGFMKLQVAIEVYIYVSFCSFVSDSQRLPGHVPAAFLAIYFRNGLPLFPF